MDWIGWIATAAFAGSYFCKDQRTLRRVQAAAATLWVIYGTIIQAMPVVAANLIVAAIALYSSHAAGRSSDRGRSGGAAAGVSGRESLIALRRLRRFRDMVR